MKNLLRILALIGVPVLALAQTATPSTTLCGAVTIAQTTVCLTSTTGVVSQTGIYVDQEYMTVILSNSQVVAAGPAYVPVSRGNRAAGSGPAAHANTAVAWIALTPSQTVVPGANGFSLRTNAETVGPCTRAAQVYLPIIYPNLNVIRDCDQGVAAPNGLWVNYNDGSTQKPSSTPQVALTTNGAIVPTSGNYAITKAGVFAGTLAAPVATIQDGSVIVIVSNTTNAHTITATGLLGTGTASVNVATFAAQLGSSLTLVAFQGKWLVLSSIGITFS